MKILIIQEAGRHIANKDFREALNLHRALTRIGVDSVVWGLNYPNFSIPFDVISKDCDAVLLLENYEINNWVPDLSTFDKLKMFWSIDSHCVLTQHINTCNRNNIDIVLNAIESHQVFFPNQKTYYFPNAYPDDLIYPMDNIEKTINLGFCGNKLNRGSWLTELSNKLGLRVDEMVIGNDMVKAINSYKIHFNRNISEDLNYRTFETLGCRTLLFTNLTENVDKLFNIGEHLIIYNSMEDFIDKYNDIINDPVRMNHIAESGYNYVKSNHTFVNRAQKLVEIINYAK